MSSHQHLGAPHMTQNQGNVIGDKPCVRQSRLYREHVGGNAMKDVLGQGDLKWDTTRTQGAYAGGTAHDPLADHPQRQQQQQQQQPAQHYEQQQPQQFAQQPQQVEPQPQASFARGRGSGNQSSAGYNILNPEGGAPTQQRQAQPQRQFQQQQQQPAQQQGALRGRGGTTQSSAGYNILSHE